MKIIKLCNLVNKYYLLTKMAVQDTYAPVSVEEAKATLNISSDLNMNLLKEKYREAILANHPDRGGSNEKLLKINAAFTYLKDKLETEMPSSSSYMQEPYKHTYKDENGKYQDIITDITDKYQPEEGLRVRTAVPKLIKKFWYVHDFLLENNYVPHIIIGNPSIGGSVIYCHRDDLLKDDKYKFKRFIVIDSCRGYGTATCHLASKGFGYGPDRNKFVPYGVSTVYLNEVDNRSLTEQDKNPLNDIKYGLMGPLNEVVNIESEKEKERYAREQSAYQHSAYRKRHGDPSMPMTWDEYDEMSFDPIREGNRVFIDSLTGDPQDESSAIILDELRENYRAFHGMYPDENKSHEEYLNWLRSMIGPLVGDEDENDE